MTKFRKTALILTSVVLAASVGAIPVSASFAAGGQKSSATVSKVEESTIEKLEVPFDTRVSSFFDENVVTKLPDSLSEEEEISLIVSLGGETVVDNYISSDGSRSLNDYISSFEARSLSSEVSAASDAAIRKLKKAGVCFTAGEKYDRILNGFEITVKAKDYDTVSDILGDEVTLIIGETYEEEAAKEIITNEVDVYETGIFDSHLSEYQGDGVLIAVLDTGLDYTHTAFSDDNFRTSNEAFTREVIASRIAGTEAAKSTSGLSVADVYRGRKVPFAYDYADKDTDVFPINSEHGTHVAGIIAGKDDVITGVAPRAQLAIMKVFSDYREGAKTSWILAGLEDCVNLGVDVINMSLGSACGFAREEDKVEVNRVYDRIKDAGISLVVAAGNDYSATFGSEKNGRNPLTENPDSGVVGSPSTYSAALSVASVEGVKTPYFTFNGSYTYFEEANDSSGKQKHFVDEILATVGSDVNEYTFDYVTIPGIGNESDYSKDDYSGKIVLVKRGDTTFEDKVRIALKEKHAAGVIIYNNVSGSITMTIGKSRGAVCSITQEDGEAMAAYSEGKITISKSQVAGPFMSDFSSWGPTSDLQIKPEITAHGGQIYSAIPGQSYDRLSGTSMACPNQAGATALIRQFVKSNQNLGKDLSPKEVTALVNQLMMSTADIIRNKNGVPAAVRKQGAGLVNITKAAQTAAYITSYDKNGNAMDKSKFELGDDKEEKGVYEMTFDITNFVDYSVSYNLSATVLTEGVSVVYTSHGDTVSTEEGYVLSGSKTEVISVNGSASSGNTVTVGAGQTVKVTVRITLSDEDKQYMKESFANGIYVEGFVHLDAASGTTVNMSAPFLAFFGDWTKAPIFDEEYYDTNADELNDGIDKQDKLMPDAYSTRAIGKLYSDYITALGSYVFTQDPKATKISADKEKIAISNKLDEESSTVNSLEYIWAGLLRNVKEVDIKITEDATGTVVFERTEKNVHKSFSSGNNIYPSSIDVEYSAIENNLKNNTRYTVTVDAYIDYGDKSEQKNEKNRFEFPLYIDFEAPTITDVEYYTEYDKTTKKTSLFAKLYVYDNHYAMGVSVGQLVKNEDKNSRYELMMRSFSKYVTPVLNSPFNSVSTVTVDLTDHIAEIKQSLGTAYNDNGTSYVVEGTNSFIATCYDYALNAATFEIRLPDEILAMYFNEESIELYPGEAVEMSSLLEIYPEESWIATLDFTSDNEDVVSVVNGTLIAKSSGTARVKVKGYTATLEVIVLDEDGGYTIPDVNNFTITSYTTNKAYYIDSGSDRDIGETGFTYNFDGVYELKMYPSESVTLNCKADSYFSDKSITFTAGNSRIATVDENGTITALAEGNTTIAANVKVNGKNTRSTIRISIEVKDPYEINGIYLTSYRGLGGEVKIPDDRGFTTIYNYAFSGSKYVEKNLDEGDVIDDEDPYHIKQTYVGEDTITKIEIPEGVTTINAYAFAGLTALREVKLPTTLTRIGLGAFYQCENLEKVNFEHVQFINKDAFSGCKINYVDCTSLIAVGDYAFKDCAIGNIEFSDKTRSIGIGAFEGNEDLATVKFDAPQVIIGSSAFEGCKNLTSVSINASVISSYAFYNSGLENVTLGKDVSVIGEYAFARTKIERFNLVNNEYLSLGNDGKAIYDATGKRLIAVVPLVNGERNFTFTTDAEIISMGAFAGNLKLTGVVATNAKVVEAYAFAGCSGLTSATFGRLSEIGEMAFASTAFNNTPDLSTVKTIGKMAFYNSSVTDVEIPESCGEIGEYAFANCPDLRSVVIGNGVKIGANAFGFVNLFDEVIERQQIMFAEDLSYKFFKIEGNVVSVDERFFYWLTPDSLKQLLQSFNYVSYRYEVKDDDGNVKNVYTCYRFNYSAGNTSKLASVVIGDGVIVGDRAFAGNSSLTELTIGNQVEIGNYAFFNDFRISEVDLSGVKAIGDYAFSGNAFADVMFIGDEVGYARNLSVKDGEIVEGSEKYTTFSAAISEADLSAAEKVGVGAFAYNHSLKSVKLGDRIAEINAETFKFCSELTEIDLSESVENVYAYAFYGADIKDLDLSNVSRIGDDAFAYSSIESVVLKEGAEIGDGAFSYCSALTDIDLSEAVKIGKEAFRETSFAKADLRNATEIGSFAFARSSVVDITLGEGLEILGENPFYGCRILTYGKVEDITFNGKKTGEKLNEDYDISDKVKVIGGALYFKTPNGLQIVSYPIGKNEDSYVIAEGTVRVGARAFEGANLSDVTLPTTVRAIGDKAFYGCGNLSTVIFTSYYAPLFEEEFDENYFVADNYPYVSEWNGKGLEISKYSVLNLGTNHNAVYFGANFVDHIGRINRTIVAVRPANGENYDSFIMKWYFGKIVAGGNAATEEALRVIALINALPDTRDITLDAEGSIVSARQAYERLPNNEQKALVDNAVGTKLSESEGIIQYLKNRASENTDEPTDPEDNKQESKGFGEFLKNNAVGLIIALVIALGFVAYVVISRKSTRSEKKTNEADLKEPENGEKTEKEEVENSDEKSENDDSDEKSENSNSETNSQNQ